MSISLRALILFQLSTIGCEPPKAAFNPVATSFATVHCIPFPTSDSDGWMLFHLKCDLGACSWLLLDHISHSWLPFEGMHAPFCTQDTINTPAARQAFLSTVQQQQRHAAAVLNHIKLKNPSNAATSTSRANASQHHQQQQQQVADDVCWTKVEVAAQQLLRSSGAARSRLRLLESLLSAHDKLITQVQMLQLTPAARQQLLLQQQQQEQEQQQQSQPLRQAQGQAQQERQQGRQGQQQQGVAVGAEHAAGQGSSTLQQSSRSRMVRTPAGGSSGRAQARVAAARGVPCKGSAPAVACASAAGTNVDELTSRLAAGLGLTSSSSSSSSGSSSLAEGKSGSLTPFELHLLFNPQLLQQYKAALEHATPLLQKQLECVSCAKVFFAWAASALEVGSGSSATQEQATGQQQQAAQELWQGSLRGPSHGRGGPRSLCTGSSGSRSSTSSSRGNAAGGGGGVAAEELVPLVGQLPKWQSSLAGQVLQQVQKQLRKAVAEAGLQDGLQEDLGRGVGGGQRGAVHATTAAVACVSGGGMRGPAGGQMVGYVQAAAKAVLQAGVGFEPEPVLLQLPGDVTRALQLQDAEQEAKEAERMEHEREQQCGMKSMLYKVLGKGPWEESHGGLGGFLSTSSTSGGAGLAGAGGQGVAVVDVKGELDRLRGMALSAARQHACVRAADKQRLAAAAAGLLEEGGEGLQILDGLGL